jgi:hypothetical protein
MNELLAGIYGTGDMEKVASPVDPTRQMTLDDLATVIVVDSLGDGADMEKVAEAHQEVFADLVSFDRAGRAMAHHEFTEMEKMAAAGDTEALEAFFADVEFDDGGEPDPRHAAREAIAAELQRRAGLQ